jgi:hypothetical protein
MQSDRAELAPVPSDRPAKKPRGGAAAAAAAAGRTGAAGTVGTGGGGGTGAYRPIGRHESAGRQEAHARELYAQALSLLAGSDSAEAAARAVVPLERLLAVPLIADVTLDDPPESTAKR